MTGVADTFEKASFDGIEFPWSERTIKCSLRHHTHEYPHAAGGDDEALGRRLYEFGFSCDFDTGFGPSIYPYTLVLLFATFGEEKIAPLVIPGFGTFSARCIDWDSRKVTRITSGEKVNFKFLEVLDDIIVANLDFTNAPLALPQYMTVLKTQVTQLAAAPLGILPANARPSVASLSTIETLTAMLAATTTTNTALVTQRAGALFGACSTYDETQVFLRYPRSYAVINALHALAKASLLIYKDGLRRGRRIEIYVNDRVRSISEIATKIYGSTEKTQELMQINTLPDALFVQAGRPIRYYTKAA